MLGQTGVNPLFVQMTLRHNQSDATSHIDKVLTNRPVWGGLTGGVIMIDTIPKLLKCETPSVKHKCSNLV